MFFTYLIPLVLIAQSPNPTPPKAPEVESLSFQSKSFRFEWEKPIQVDLEVDGLKVHNITFNQREFKSAFGSAQWGPRAQLQVTNTSSKSKVPGFAVAVLDANGKLVGVASGGTRIGTVKPGETETFDLSFTQVRERVRKGEKFLLSVELRD